MKAIPNNRIGRFKISRDVILNWKTALEVMRHFVVIRVDWRVVHDIGEYTAFSELFEPVEEGVEPFCYEIMLTRTEEQPLSVSAKRTEYFA